MRKIFFVLAATLGAASAWAQEGLSTGGITAIAPQESPHQTEEQYMQQWAAKTQAGQQQAAQQDASNNAFVVAHVSDLRGVLALWDQALRTNDPRIHVLGDLNKVIPDGVVMQTLYNDVGVAMFGKLGVVTFRQMPDGSLKWEITSFESKNVRTKKEARALTEQTYWGVIRNQCNILIKQGTMTSCNNILPKEYQMDSAPVLTASPIQAKPVEARPMTAADVAAFRKAHPDVPQPLGGGMYRVHLYSGGTAIMTDQQWDDYSTQHYQKCQMGIPDHCEK
ncbi:MAG: hypothetical protein ACTHNE_19910 [Dyella sp.]|uniref:hypothetical protein n=1 Tax=Dyella sp. TaxID=1869338 RepID=UPI003F81133C